MSDKRHLHQLQDEYNRFKKAPKYGMDSEELYCVCRKPDTGQLMVACDGCDEWFHFKCMDIDIKYKELVNNYYCKFCDELFHKGKTLWKRKCRLPGCYKPAAISTDKVSKYCCEEHGVEFLQKYVVEPFTKDEAVELGDVGSMIGTYDEFEKLGQLPKWVQASVETPELAELAAKEKLYTSQEAYLGKLKERIKLLNETISQKAPKKVDICGYDERLRNWPEFEKSDDYKRIIAGELNTDKVYEQYLECLDGGDQAKTEFAGLCLADRKKCKHLTWYTIQMDTLDLQLAQVTTKMNLLREQQRKDAEAKAIESWASSGQ